VKKRERREEEEQDKGKGYHYLKSVVCHCCRLVVCQSLDQIKQRQQHERRNVALDSKENDIVKHSAGDYD
jgi:hypothetical protein